jgi:endonuclease/exonuclease/phosphatase family metal-dependent hydrolase
LKKIIYKILLILNLIIAAALLLAYLAVVISPAKAAFPACFGLAYPYLLLLNIMMIIAWAMLLRFEAFISAAVIVIGITHFSNSIKFSKSKDDKADSFKVISYNVHMFKMFGSKKAENTERAILNLLKEADADIICLQEVSVSGDVKARERSIQTALGRKHASYLKTNRSYGIMILSKYPVIAKGDIVYPESAGLTIYADVLINQDTIRIYNNHLQSFNLTGIERTFVEDIIGDDEKMNRVKSLWSRLKRGFVKRALQSQALKEHINTSEYKVIVTGDFNDTPVSYAYYNIRKGLNDSFVNSGHGAAFTYRGAYPPNRIDYILYDKTIINNNFEVIKAKYSDHYPIAAWFKK